MAFISRHPFRSPFLAFLVAIQGLIQQVAIQNNNSPSGKANRWSAEAPGVTQNPWTRSWKRFQRLPWWCPVLPRPGSWKKFENRGKTTFNKERITTLKGRPIVGKQLEMGRSLVGTFVVRVAAHLRLPDPCEGAKMRAKKSDSKGKKTKRKHLKRNRQRCSFDGMQIEREKKPVSKPEKLKHKFLKLKFITLQIYKVLRLSFQSPKAAHGDRVLLFRLSVWLHGGRKAVFLTGSKRGENSRKEMLFSWRSLSAPSVEFVFVYSWALLAKLHGEK